MRIRKGAWVRIGRFKTRLIKKLDDVEGGWEVDPPVEGFRYWNRDAMKPVARQG